MVRKVSERNFREEVLNSGTLSVVDFSTNWCVPCRPALERLEELSQEYEGKVNFFTVDVEENPELSDKLNILKVPTLVFFKDDRSETLAGLKSRDAIRNKIEELIGGE